MKKWIFNHWGVSLSCILYLWGVSLSCDYYFCHPYSSWERGLNENINGLIRQYIPKGSSFNKLTKKNIKTIEDKLNHRPKKSLNWKTPYEVFYESDIAS